MLTKEKKQEIIKEYQTKEGDTGSPEVQVAILTYRINDLDREETFWHTSRVLTLRDTEA